MKTKIAAILFAFVLFFSPLYAHGICESGVDANPNELCNPITGVGSLPVFALRVLNVFYLGISSVTIIYVMFAGFRMIISQGDTEAVSKAKQALTWSISGMVLAMFAYVLVYAVSNYVGVKPFDPGVFENSPQPVINPIGSNNFGELIVKMITGFLGIAGFLAILLIIINGFRFVTASGNEEQAEQARKGLQWAILGLIVILFAYVLVKATATFFRTV